MRRIIILLLLLGVMQLISLVAPLGGAGRSLLVFGFLILAAYSAGELARSVRLPKIIGYMIAGAIFGPHLAAVVRPDEVSVLTPVSDLAIALIAFLAGAELEWSELRKRGVALLKLTGAELAVTFVAISALLLVMREWIPFLAGTNIQALLAFTILFASIAIVHSPAATMALLSETGARGPVAKTTLGIVLLADVVVVVLFSLALALARTLVPSGAAGVGTLGSTMWEVGGAVPVGALIGLGVALYLRISRSELFLLAILGTFFGLEVAKAMHVEPLLTLLVAGFVAQNASLKEAGHAMRDAMERSAAPIFVVFFALAGAKLELEELLRLWPIVLPIVVVRAAGIWSGVRVGQRWAGTPPAEGRLLWMGLVAQAGVAIGLVDVAHAVYPAVGGDMRTILLALIAVDQTIGPILFRRALLKAGEVQGVEGKAPVRAHEEPKPAPGQA